MIIDLSSDFITENFKKMKQDFVNRFLKNLQIEQIAYRMYLCESCLKNGKCSGCDCNPIDLLTEPYSCNDGKIFPNFMNQNSWNDFKKKT